MTIKELSGKSGNYQYLCDDGIRMAAPNGNITVSDMTGRKLRLLDSQGDLMVEYEHSPEPSLQHRLNILGAK